MKYLFFILQTTYPLYVNDLSFASKRPVLCKQTTCPLQEVSFTYTKTA